MRVASHHQDDLGNVGNVGPLDLHPKSIRPLVVASQVKLVGKQRLVLDLSCRQRDGR